MKSTVQDIRPGDRVVIGDNSILIETVEDGMYGISIENQNLLFSQEGLFKFMNELEEQGAGFVFTHNCQFRMVCGRLGRTASMMALESTLATTIDGNKKGAGIIASNGIIEHVQYYYAPQSWIEDWYKKRGLNNKGYDPQQSGGIEDAVLEDFDGEEELIMNREVTEIDFAGVQGSVDKSDNQKFNEIQY